MKRASALPLRPLPYLTDALTTKERAELDARVKRTNPDLDYRLMVTGPFSAFS